MTSENSKKNILIVDDSAFEQRMLAELLSDEPYRFSVAYNGYQGYQLALATHPDLILLDVRMPEMDGYTACRLLKANPETEHIPVIFLSGADAVDERVLGLQVGGVDYISKPFTPAELAARIHIHLGLMRRANAAAPAPDSDQPPQHPDLVFVNAVKQLILDNLGSLPNLSEIARSVGTYREKLTLMFREQSGMTVFAFIREARIARGVELLQQTEIDVQDIALLIGFHNAGNFATAFRERMGVTPTAYRQRLLEQRNRQGGSAATH
ncbi:Helix-turn-helix protein domain-containing protein [Janthinobacterium psychrotolerans]|uniref:Helix-turn-helix protein domain-containing protein n=2 Tax=Janthinobacterium psychrotolerans TaxID=1747903 RepID=A0A1A7BX27_9BURK|nr:Helix-turn-helix protein domain-containing protein [Janthinobacterium psychrotolerans]